MGKGQSKESIETTLVDGHRVVGKGRFTSVNPVLGPTSFPPSPDPSTLEPNANLPSILSAIDSVCVSL